MKATSNIACLQVDKDTTKLAYMRAAMTSLAYVHGITYSYMKVETTHRSGFHYFSEFGREGAAPGRVPHNQGAGEQVPR